MSVPVQQIDLLPTLLEAAGVERPRAIGGTSLMPWLGAGERAAPGSGRSHGDPSVVSLIDVDGVRLESVTAGEWRLIRDPTAGGDVEELYHLRDDPGETRNLAASKPEIAARLGARIDAVTREVPANRKPEAVTLDRRLERELRALGYL